MDNDVTSEDVDAAAIQLGYVFKEHDDGCVQLHKLEQIGPYLVHLFGNLVEAHLFLFGYSQALVDHGLKEK